MLANALLALRGIMGRAARGVRHGGERGQTLVEFSLILPLFLVLIFALVDFGRAYYSFLLVTNAAREGARAAAVQGDSATIDKQVYGSFCSAASPPSGCALGPTGVTVTKTNVQGARGTQASVTVAYAFSFVTPVGNLLGLIGGSTLSTPTISSTTAMRLE